MTDRTQLESLLDSLELELRVEGSERSSQASDESLAWAIGKLRDAERLLEDDRVNAALCVSEVARRAVDSWSLSASVTDEAVGLAQRLRQKER